jgi:anaerobic carbon-monoxide dehydrogenase iron sulfur subunit
MPSRKRLVGDDSLCTGCGTCMATCSKLFFKTEDPERSSIRISDSSDGGHHITVCDQECRLCVAECPVKALGVSAQGVVLLDRKLCIGCLACVAVCPIGAMRYYPGSPSPFKCVACGACAKKCPTGAIQIRVEEA